MDKKKATAWGVGFGSLALVAGMTSYLDLTNSSNTSQQTQTAVQNSIQQTQGSNSQFSFNNSSNNNSNAAASNNNFFSNQQGFLSTTTGGS